MSDDVRPAWPVAGIVATTSSHIAEGAHHARWNTAEVKNNETRVAIASEYGYLRPDLTLFTYLHLAANEPLTQTLIDSDCVSVAYETVQLADGSLPLLAPMSEVAGRMAMLVGAYHRMSSQGGRGVLASGVPGVRPAKVAVIGAVLVADARAPKLVTHETVAAMKPGSVLVDIAIDQGGCFQDSHATTHADPTYKVENSLFYCVANMPGAVGYTSTVALTNATLPYALALANHGWAVATAANPALAKGLAVVDGRIVNAPTAQAFPHLPAA